MKQKIKKIEQKLDINKHLPKNYLNKKIIWSGFIVFILIIGFAIITYGFNKDFVYLECETHLGCDNPFIYCEDQPFNFNCLLIEDLECEGKNCEKARISKGDYIGEKPPFFIKNFVLITLIIFLLTFVINHLYYILKVMKNEKKMF